jgi:hypothetical protein
MPNPALAFSEMIYSGAVANGAVYSYNTNYITLQNLDIRGATNGIQLSNCDYWIIEDCNIGMYSGEMGVKLYPGAKGSSDYIIIRNCAVDSGKRFANNWYNEDPGEGIILENANYCKIYSNNIIDWCHAGVGLSGSMYPVTYNEVYNNYITCEHVDYGRPLGCGGNTINCAHNKLYNNYIYNCGARTQIGGQYNEFYSNIIDTMVNDRTPYFPDRAQGLMISTYETTMNKNNKYYRNIFYNCDESGIFVRAYATGDTFRIVDNNIEKNIIIDCGMDSGGDQSSLGIMIKDDNVGANTYTGNCIVNTKGLTNTVFYRGIGVFSVSAFNSMTGTKGDIIQSNIYSFISSENQDAVTAAVNWASKLSSSSSRFSLSLLSLLTGSTGQTPAESINPKAPLNLKVLPPVSK